MEFRKYPERGFTLLELMVVLLILTLLATITAPAVMKHLARAKNQTAQIQVNSLASSIEFFHLDVRRYPTQDEGLRVLIEAPASESLWDGPYVKKADALVDPWGRPYLYRYPGSHGAFDVYSLGEDGREGGAGNARAIGNW
jgi:general secretion pathway protein G